MNNKKKIIIAHIHVSDQKNKGDLAIVLAVQELLRKRFPDSVIKDFPATVLRDGKATDLKKINKADLIIIGGGGLFYSYFLPYSLEFIAGLQKPLFIFGVGYIREIGAPPLDKKSIDSLVALCQKSTLIGVRDNNTKSFLVKQGVDGDGIFVIGDPAVLLEEKKNNKLVEHSGVFPVRLGLNINYSGWFGFGKWEDDILSAYRELIHYFQDKFAGPDGPGLEVYYLKHHPGEDNIYPKLAFNDLRLIDLEPAEQKYVYGQLDLVVGMMLHVAVLSFGAGTPEISVAYDIRNYSFAEFIACPELVVDLDRLKDGQLLEQVDKVFKNRYKYRRWFKEQKKMIKSREKEFLEKIKY